MNLKFNPIFSKFLTFQKNSIRNLNFAARFEIFTIWNKTLKSIFWEQLIDKNLSLLQNKLFAWCSDNFYILKRNSCFKDLCFIEKKEIFLTKIIWKIKKSCMVKTVALMWSVWRCYKKFCIMSWRSRKLSNMWGRKIIVVAGEQEIWTGHFWEKGKKDFIRKRSLF